MKQRRIIATILTIILTVATVLTVFAAFRFEVQFPSKLNTFTYDQSSASFKLNGNNSFTLNLSDPGSAGNFSAVVVGDKDVPATEGNESTPATPGRAGTPLMYSYKLSLGEGYDIEQNKVLLSSIFVYLNGEIQGTLYSVMTDNLGMIGTTSYVLPNDSVTDDLRLELHLASDATPYVAETNDITVTVNCTATNHNAQKITFVSSDDELAQAISEVNRGAQNKTIVLYGGFELSQDYEIKKPCTLDLNNVNFNGKTVKVNITGGVTEGEPTDVVTVTGAGATNGKFSITAGAIDRKDSASNVTIDGVANANAYSVQYIIDNQLDTLLAHGISAGETIDLSTKGFGCYVSSLTSSDKKVFDIDDEDADADDDLLISFTAKNLTVSKTATLTVTLTSKVPESEGSNNLVNVTHDHTVKVIGASDAVFARLFAAEKTEDVNGQQVTTPAGELYYLSQLTNPGVDVSYSVPLPTVIKSINATIEWHSSDPEKFSNQGVCSPSANGYVTLTAVIRINEQVFTKDLRIHIATLTNKDRLEAMISAMGTITLNKLYPSEADGNNDGLIDGNYSDLPLAHALNSGYEQYFQFAIPQDGETTRQLSTFDISELTYSIDKATYSYIDLVEFTDTPAQGDTPAQTHQVVVLRQSTFNTLAEVQVTAKFETGDSKEETSVIYVNIQLGENKALGDQVLAYVRNKLSEVNVLQNMLDTRVNGEEKGDFELPAEYSGFDIIYQVKKDTNIVTTVNVDEDKNKNIVENGEFEINAEGFKNVAHDVTVTVSVLIKDTHTISTNNVIASDDMTFTVPAAIHCDTTYGFSDSTLFQSVRTQVMEQATPAYSKNGDAFVDADKNYILVRDIENCTTLNIDGTDVTNVCLNGLTYFTNLTTFEARDFTGQTDKLSRAAATFKSLNSLTLSNVGLTDLTPVLELDLAYLNVSDNEGLKDISGVAKYDATKLAVLNISGTAVNMDLSRSLLTAMYYRYEAKNNTAPKYLYTHEYTPIADGALLLEPDAISVTTDPTSKVTTATIGGDELLINGATYSDNKITIGSSDTAISIDGKKSVSVKAGTQITVIKGEVHQDGSTISVNAGIISFELKEQGMKSESFQIADLWMSGTVTITNATVTNNIITVGEGGGSLDSTIDDEDMTLTQGTIPILSGIITTGTVNNQPAVIISPLKNGNGNYKNSELSDEGANTTITSASLTRIDITGASLSGTTITVGPNGGTIIVYVNGTKAYEFAVRSNTNIQANTPGNIIRTDSNGIISILPLEKYANFPEDASEVRFSNATITDEENGNNSNGQAVRVPVITANSGCTVTIDGVLTLILPEQTQLQLPSNAVGRVLDNNTVLVQNYHKSGIPSSYGGKDIKFRLINATRTSDNDNAGWEVNRSTGLGTVTFTAEASITSRGSSYIVLENNTVWIPINFSEITLKGDTYKREWFGSDPSSGYWGQINYTSTTGVIEVTLNTLSSTQSNIDLTSALTTASDSKFSITQLTISENMKADPKISLLTETINPNYSGIRATLPNATQSIAPNVVDYFGEKIQYFGCSLSGTTVTPTDGYQWYAILLDGEYITISDGASVTVTGSEGDYQVTVTNGTSTIGKGALVTTENVNVTHSTSTVTEKTTGIFSVSGGDLPGVKVKYSKPSGSTTIIAHIDDLIFEPIVANDEEKAGVNILFLLSEVPGVSHYDYNKGQNNAHGTYIQLAPTVHYGNGGLSVNVTWSVAPDSVTFVKYADYNGSPRLETLRPATGLTFVDGVAKKDVTVIAQVNVQGVVSTRYFTFTVTYYSN